MTTRPNSPSARLAFLADPQNDSAESSETVERALLGAPNVPASAGTYSGRLRQLTGRGQLPTEAADQLGDVGPEGQKAVIREISIVQDARIDASLD
jgi:hypothetical protein